MEGGAEVAQAVVAYSDGGFGHVALAGAEEFSGAFHPDLANVLLDGHAGFLGEETAQIKWTAADFFAELFEGRRFFEAFAQDQPGAFDAFARGALRARAEEIAAGGAEEKQRGEFKGLAAEPHFARGLEDGTLLETLDELEMQRAEALGLADFAACGGTGNDFSNGGIEVFFLGAEMFAEKIAREFDRDEAMFLPAEAQRFEAGIALVIKDERARGDFDFVFAVGNGAGAVEVHADFDAVRMKAPAPIEVLRGMEFVPLEAEPEFAEAAEHRPPPSADRAPRRFFHEVRGSGCGFARELFHRLARAENSAGRGAVGAVGEFNGQADQVVVARLHVRENKAFDDPDFWTEQSVMRFDAIFVKASHR